MHEAKETARISKLRFYSDASVGITEEIKDEIVLTRIKNTYSQRSYRFGRGNRFRAFQVVWEDFDEATLGRCNEIIL
jgi:hypothetical protein